MTAENKVSGWVSMLSALSAWSLILFGLLSLLFSGISSVNAGTLIGLALLVHGIYEVRQRKILIRGTDNKAHKRLAWNQMALAVSVSLYLGWQAFRFDEAELDALLARDPFKTALLQLPPDTTELLARELPRMLMLTYALAGFVVVVGCIGMAALYARSRAE